MYNELNQILEFIREIDKVKGIYRRTKLFDQSRYENDAEHSWHLALMALTLKDYANEKIDVNKVIEMVLIHDIVEIDAGDYIVYTTEKEEKQKKEKAAAKRIFGILPDKLKDEIYALWDEFEAEESPEAKFASAIDRLEPIMQNYYSNGEAWKKHNIHSSQILKVNRKIEKGSIALWEYAKSLIEETVEKGYIE
jgi:putative hydrolase of HD superfamily